MCGQLRSELTAGVTRNEKVVAASIFGGLGSFVKMATPPELLPNSFGASLTLRCASSGAQLWLLGRWLR